MIGIYSVAINTTASISIITDTNVVAADKSTTATTTTTTTAIDTTGIEQICVFPFFPCGPERGDNSNPEATSIPVSDVKVGGDYLESGTIKVVSTVLKINAIVYT